ncbi:MAG: hypothetical protein QM723_32155 [Myxococcaceae bacterium]
MPSPPKFELKIDRPVPVPLIKAHMAGSLGVDAASKVVDEALAPVGLGRVQLLTGDQATEVLQRLGRQTGLVGLAAKVTFQMVRNNVAPLNPAF